MKGLQPGTQYEFEIIATNEAGDGIPRTGTFTTDADVVSALHATPDGSGTDCTQAAPCALQLAADEAYAGDSISVAPGTYGTAADPILARLSEDVSIQGTVVGPGRPVILGRVSAAGDAVVSDLEIRGAGDHPLELVNGALGNRLIVRQASLAGYDSCWLLNAKLRDSLCTDAGPTFGSALYAEGQGLATGVTAEGENYGGYLLNGGSVTSSIMRGGTANDLNASTASVLASSNFATLGGGVPASNVGQVSAAPVYRGANDFRQAGTSPTIDTGHDAAVEDAELDLNGNLRKLGAHVDIGAYEHVPSAPGITLGAPIELDVDRVKLSFTVEQQGWPGRRPRDLRDRRRQPRVVVAHDLRGGVADRRGRVGDPVRADAGHDLRVQGRRHDRRRGDHERRRDVRHPGRRRWRRWRHPDPDPVPESVAQPVAEPVGRSGPGGAHTPVHPGPGQGQAQPALRDRHRGLLRRRLAPAP